MTINKYHAFEIIVSSEAQAAVVVSVIKEIEKSIPVILKRKDIDNHIEKFFKGITDAKSTFTYIINDVANVITSARIVVKNIHDANCKETVDGIPIAYHNKEKDFKVINLCNPFFDIPTDNHITDKSATKLEITEPTKVAAFFHELLHTLPKKINDKYYGAEDCMQAALNSKYTLDVADCITSAFRSLHYLAETESPTSSSHHLPHPDL